MKHLLCLSKKSLDFLDFLNGLDVSHDQWLCGSSHRHSERKRWSANRYLRLLSRSNTGRDQSLCFGIAIGLSTQSEGKWISSETKMLKKNPRIFLWKTFRTKFSKLFATCFGSTLAVWSSCWSVSRVFAPFSVFSSVLLRPISSSPSFSLIWKQWSNTDAGTKRSTFIFFPIYLRYWCFRVILCDYRTLY